MHLAPSYLRYKMLSFDLNQYLSRLDDHSIMSYTWGSESFRFDDFYFGMLHNSTRPIHNVAAMMVKASRSFLHCQIFLLVF